jgi:hypothetical protein
MWKDGRLPWGVLLTGGASKIHGLDLLAKQTFKLASFYAKDHQLHVWELSSNPQFITTLWLYLRASRYNETKKGMFSFNMSFGNLFNPIRNLFKKVF